MPMSVNAIMPLCNFNYALNIEPEGIFLLIMFVIYRCIYRLFVYGIETYALLWS
jgi:hypothetical protein